MTLSPLIRRYTPDGTEDIGAHIFFSTNSLLKRMI